MDKPKVAFCTADTMGCGFYRMIQPAHHMALRGWQISIYSGHFDYNMVATNDFIILQRQYSEQALEFVQLLRKAKKKVVYEIDDYLHGVLPTSPVYTVYKPGSKANLGAEAIMRECDGMFVSTAPLANVYGPQNKNMFVLPNFVNPDYFYRIKTRVEKEVRIGWTGSWTHYSDIKEVADVLPYIVDKYPQVKLVFLGYIPLDSIIKVPLNRIEFKQGVSVFDYPSILATMELDIGLAPLLDCNFNRCKSNLKFLEYSACRVPTVASNVTPYAGSIKNEETGFIAEKPKDWIKILSKLIENETLRKEVGERAHNTIKENYTPDVCLKYWEDAIMKVWEMPRIEPKIEIKSEPVKAEAPKVEPPKEPVKA